MSQCKSEHVVQCALTQGHETYAVHLTPQMAWKEPAAEKLRAERQALVELAQAASLVVAEWDLRQVELQDAELIELHEDVERLRGALKKHMPAIEACQAAPAQMGGGT